MPANYLHGVETIVLDKGPRPIRVVKSSVIAIVGTAPIGPYNTPTLVQSASDAAQFGTIVPNFSIPRALDMILAEGGGAPIIVVNVFKESEHADTVTDEVVTVTNGKFQTANPPISSVVVTNSGATTTYVNGTDYTYDSFGNFTIVPTGAITEGQSLKVDYKWFDGTTVLGSDIIGTTNNADRTGLQALDQCFNTFGFNPKIIICPGFSTISGVATEMIEKADAFRGHCILDADNGVPVADILTNRGPLSGDTFATSSKRAILAYPRVKVYDLYNDDDIETEYSPTLAGVIANVDLNEGYWVSPSNHEIKGITGIEFPLTAAINSATTDANILNEVGVVTIFSGYGAGYRVWGNRSAAYPASTDTSNFICVQRVADIIHESVELAMLQFLDKPINNAMIDSIKESVNAFIRTLIQRGALVDGSCTYDPNDNPPVELAVGHLTFGITFMPPTPAERITFNSFIDINLLQGLGA